MKRPDPLSEADVRTALSKLPGWEGSTADLHTSLHFKTFADAIRFMGECVSGIDQRDHHPIWTNKYNTVTITLTTFDIGNKVTALDVDLAAFLDEMARRCGVKEQD